MKLVQKSLILSISAACAAFLGTHTTVDAQDTASAPYAAYYNAEKGFKPAQRDFTTIFLQLGGSLEYHGNPEPYIRHVLSEHARISAKYNAATGREYTARPKYLTDEFVENLLGKWNKLNASVKLESLCRQSGRNMRLAIMGTWNMPADELVAEETKLNDKERKEFASFITKDYFKKSDFEILEPFYADGGGWNKLSETGKNQMSKRTARGIMSPDERAADIRNDKNGSFVVKLLNSHQEKLIAYMTDSKQPVNADDLIATLKSGLKLDQKEIKLDGMREYERDAFQFSHAIKSNLEKRFVFIDQHASSPEDTKNMKASLLSMIENLAVIAHSEFQAGLLESSAQ